MKRIISCISGILLGAILLSGCEFDSYRKTQETVLKGDNATWNPQTGAVTGAVEFRNTTWGDSETKKILTLDNDAVSKLLTAIKG